MKEQKKKKKKTTKQQQLSFTKKIMLFILFNAILQIWATYVLAFLDKTEVVENLSTQTTITIVGVAFAYMAKACVENLSKHKNDKKAEDSIIDDICLQDLGIEDILDDNQL